MMRHSVSDETDDHLGGSDERGKGHMVWIAWVLLGAAVVAILGWLW
jgi:hypothetical protein